ncbi:MAG: insulinase family protein [Anaerolineae bacterium]|nr:insulinase family protein [Anaerolineae bacterium]
MTTIHGFELIREQEIPEINTRARLFRHMRTGAELISMENDDTNKVFGVTFATPPADSTGLPHILEHSVLCGSRKYPVKDPFIQLAKGSLNTFLNAFTFSDKTCYPVASQNLQDFYNLIDVYLDAVFYPRITPEILQQEGWHYELEQADEPLNYKGVVFNEMKGAFSSPDGVLARWSQQSLFPDTVYGVESGGDPKHIPDLTYAQFKTFHDTYYHPSNAKIWFYGDDDPDERLRVIDAFIADFDRIEVQPDMPLQPRFNQPRTLRMGFAGEDDEDSSRGLMTVNWLLAENIDPELTFGLNMLEHILLDTPASPLRKALIDSGLGEDVTGGIDEQVREMYFSAGLKGIDSEDAPKVEALIFDTLTKLAEEGIDPDMIEASVNTVEFSLREYNTGGFPRGLAMMISSLTTWLYGNDPLAPLAFDAPLTAIKARLANGERYFEGLIGQYLLDNPHRTTVILEPDPTVRERDEAEERARLDAERGGMTDADVEAVIENTEKLRVMQETPDTPEDLAKIPMLTLGDLDRQSQILPIATEEAHNTPLLVHDLFTNGIAYLDLGMNLKVLPQEYLPYLSLFSRGLLEMGTQTEDFVKLSQRIGRKTGGIRPTSLTATIDDQDHSAAWLFLRGKGTMTQTQDLLDILRDILLTVNFDDRERFLQIALESKAGKESGLVPGGHGVANSRLKAQFSESDWVSEQMGGVSYLFFLRDLIKRIETDWSSVLDTLEEMRTLLVNRNTMIANVTLDQDNWATFQPQLTGFIESLPTGSGDMALWSAQRGPANEGLTIPAQVNYVAKGTRLYDYGYTLHGSALVIRSFLNTAYLWEKVRVLGGAYGGFSTFDRHTGVFSFLSYRDPNLLSTLENYDGAAQYLRNLDLHPDELTKSIIGTIGSIDSYQLPDAKGYTSMIRHLVGTTDEERQRLRDEVLSTTAAHFRQFADALEAVKEHGQVFVVGSADAIQKANTELGSLMAVTKVL